MSAPRLAFAALVVAPLLLQATAAAAAPDMNACITSFDQGQRSRRELHLRRAETELLVCTQEQCPAVLRADCATVLRAVQSAVPTIVFAADDGHQDLTDVRVYVGQELIVDKLDASAKELDPGSYDFRFERAGQPPRTVHQVLREGEKNRIVRVTFPLPSTATTKIAAPSPAPPVRTRSTAGWAVPIGLGVLGLAGLGFGGLSRLSFNSDVDDLRSGCAPDCSQAQRADLSSTLVRANVSFGVGLGLLAAAGISWFLLAPSSSRTGQTRSRTAWAFGRASW